MPWRDPHVIGIAVGGVFGLVTLVLDRLLSRRSSAPPASKAPHRDQVALERGLRDVNATLGRIEGQIGNLLAVARDSNEQAHDTKHRLGNLAQTIGHIHRHVRAIARAKGKDDPAAD